MFTDGRQWFNASLPPLTFTCTNNLSIGSLMNLNCVLSFVMRQRRLSFLLLLIVMSAAPSFASSSGTALPWESPLTTVTNSLTGPVALAVSTCALFACGAVLVFGGEMTEFVKRALYAVIAISFIVGGASFISTVFSFSGATISINDVEHWPLVDLAHRVDLAREV
jgi:type IV secretion system protein VirB2